MLAALGVTTAAMAALDQPRSGVFSAEPGMGVCPLARTPKAQANVKPDHDLLLFMFGMAQGVRSRG